MLLRAAPHIIEPLAFVLPHEPHLRPAWMIRAGLFLYDHLGGRDDAAGVVRRATSRAAAGARACKPQFTRGFVYADARVDDARLVVLNALDARAKGARHPRAHARHAARAARAGVWRATLRARDGASAEVTRAGASSTPPGRG